MKSLFALLAVVLLGSSVAACGGTTKSTVSASQTGSSAAATDSTSSTTASNTTSTPDYKKVDADKDNDVGAAEDDKSNNSVLDFAQPASASEKQAITTLVKRYYAAALAGDGAKACTLLYSTLAEAVPEDYGQSPPGQPYMRGTTCPAVVTLLFKHFHSQLAAEVPVLKVSRVRLDEHHGLAVLSFAKLPERQISVAREGHIWKIEALLDSELP
jgi:hypothetical protein